MTRVRWFAVPSVTSLCHPAEQDWFCTPDATIANTEALAQLVLTEAGLPPTTTLWLRTGCGWEKVSSLAALPPGDLAVKAVVGESGALSTILPRQAATAGLSPHEEGFDEFVKAVSSGLVGQLTEAVTAIKKETLTLEASSCTSSDMKLALDRLGLTARRNLRLPCCLDPAPSLIPAATRKFKWAGPETNPVDVAAGVRWLKDHITLPGQDVVAITASSYHPNLIASFVEARVIISGSKTDFLVMSAKAVKKLRLTPGQQPNEFQLMTVLCYIAGVYESRTTMCLAELGGLGSMWTQVAAQAIAIQRMRLIDCDDRRNNEVPVFGGDFNDHLILHHSGKELHLMQNDPTPADRRLAVACMRHLLTGTAAKMPSDDGGEKEAEESGEDDDAASSEDDELLPDAPGSSKDQGQDGGPSREADRDAGGALAKRTTRSAAAKRTRQRLDAMLGPQVDAVYSATLNRLLRSPEGYKSLGMSGPPHSIEHMPFSEQIRSWTIVATSQDLK